MLFCLSVLCSNTYNEYMTSVWRMCQWCFLLTDGFRCLSLWMCQCAVVTNDGSQLELACTGKGSLLCGLDVSHRTQDHRASEKCWTQELESYLAFLCVFSLFFFFFGGGGICFFSLTFCRPPSSASVDHIVNRMNYIVVCPHNQMLISNNNK